MSFQIHGGRMYVNKQHNSAALVICNVVNFETLEPMVVVNDFTISPNKQIVMTKAMFYERYREFTHDKFHQVMSRLEESDEN